MVVAGRASRRPNRRVRKLSKKRRIARKKNGKPPTPPCDPTPPTAAQRTADNGRRNLTAHFKEIGRRSSRFFCKNSLRMVPRKAMKAFCRRTRGYPHKMCKGLWTITLERLQLIEVTAFSHGARFCALLPDRTPLLYGCAEFVRCPFRIRTSRLMMVLLPRFSGDRPP